MPLLGGRFCVKWHIPIPYSPFYNVFYPNQGGGAWVLVPLSYASDSGSARSLCSGVDQFPTLLFSFPFEFVSGKHFLSLFPFVFLFSISFFVSPLFRFPFVLLADQRGEGDGEGRGMAPLCLLSYASVKIQIPSILVSKCKEI